ncbi:hypothetical protein [Paenibacillus sp. UNC451MF]|uniref:hypothetical protein n=1 Tax=Paenibacillus sp. UNC451MF TaxID=1449063 RepID=UPI000490B8E9|nr:hypothetical protein [Paenibacillus sp. UNC451MF]
MKHIHPINEDTCREHYGKPVLIILRDGSELVGVLSRYDNGKLILNSQGTPAAATTESISSRRSDTKSKKPKIRAKTKATVSALPPGPETGFSPFGGELALDLSFIALLFLLV